MEARMTAERVSIEQRVRDFIVENFLLSDDARQFGAADSFIQNGIMDSTGILELIEFLEDTYGIQISEAETVPDNLDSLSSVAAFVSRKLQPN